MKLSYPIYLYDKPITDQCKYLLNYLLLMFIAIELRMLIVIHIIYFHVIFFLKMCDACISRIRSLLCCAVLVIGRRNTNKVRFALKLESVCRKAFGAWKHGENVCGPINTKLGQKDAFFKFAFPSFNVGMSFIIFSFIHSFFHY